LNLLQDVAERAQRYLEEIGQRRVFPAPAALKDLARFAIPLQDEPLAPSAVLAELDAIGSPFLATKVWTRGKREGIAEMERSRRRMRAERIDLMQIHNLLDWQTHLPVLREMKQAGAIRYLGVTHYAHGDLDEVERLAAHHALDRR